MKEAECAESKEKSNFLFLFLEFSVDGKLKYLPLSQKLNHIFLPINLLYLKSYQHFIFLYIQRVKLLFGLYLEHLKLFSGHGSVENPSYLEYACCRSECEAGESSVIYISKKTSCINLFGTYVWTFLGLTAISD